MPKVKSRLCMNCEEKRTCVVVVYIGEVVACPRKKNKPHQKKVLDKTKIV